MNQDKKEGYINGLCNEAASHVQNGDLELASHFYHVAIQFHIMRKLNNTDMLCRVWTELGKVYYMRWLQNRSTKNLSGATDHLKKAIQYNYPSALETFGLLSMECGNSQEAIPYLHKAAQDGCNAALNYCRIGIYYRQKKDYKSAEKFFWKAYESGDQESLRLLQTL